MRSTLTYHPVIPGSDQHLSLMARTRSRREHLGRVLYPALYERRDHAAHRRACDVMAAAAAKLAPTKQNAPDGESDAFTAPRPTPDRIEDGCSTECA